MRVEAVGDATEIGKVARQSTEQNTEPTPLNIQLTKLANLIGKIGFSVAGLAFLIFFVKDVVLVYDFSSFHTFRDWLPALQATLQYFMMAVTLIVVAVPEGLPMSVTLSLALNMRRMLSTNNLVRKMHAVSYTHLDVYKRQALWNGRCASYRSNLWIPDALRTVFLPETAR